jgi:cell division protein FtsL
LVCPNCKEEIDSIRINGYPYCPSCGERLSEEIPAILQKNQVAFNSENPEQFENPDPKIITPEGDEIFENYTKETEAQEAAMEVLESLGSEIKEEEDKEKLDTLLAASSVLEIENASSDKEEPPSLPEAPEKAQEKEIIKHNRTRITGHKSKEYILIPGEPDPIGTPELLYPHDDFIEEPEESQVAPEDETTMSEIPADNDYETEKVIPINLGGNEESGTEEPQSQEDVPDDATTEPEAEQLEAQDKKPVNHQKFLTAFLKMNAEKPNTEALKPKKEKKKTKRKWIYITLGVFLLLVLALIVLAWYATTYGTNGKIARDKAEVKASFAHLKPWQIPAGYDISYLTNANDTEINYVYAYQPDPKKTITISIKKTEVTSETLYAKIIEPSGKGYKEIKKDNREYWLVDSNSILFVADGLLYEVKTTEKLIEEDFLKIADGIQ